MRNNEIKPYEIKTWDGRSWSLTAAEYAKMNERFEAGAKFLAAPDAEPPLFIPSKIPLSDIKFFGKRQMSLGDQINETKALPEGEKKFNPLGKGYIAFIAGSIRLAIKHGNSPSKIVAKLNDEQKPLVNAELEKFGVSFRV